MPKQKVIIFDLDGTAVDSPANTLPSQRLKRALLAKADAYYFCAATGRPWRFAEPVLKYLELADPCIISGGTQICDPATGKILWQCDIEPGDVDAVMRILVTYNEHGVVLNDFSEDEYHAGGEKPAQLALPERVFFIDFIYLPESIAYAVRDKLQEIEGVTCSLGLSHNPEQFDIHITNRQATKEYAVSELLSRLSVDREHSTGIGDANNDIHLFHSVGTKVAMGNAVEALKADADLIIGDIIDDGLAKYIETLGQ